MNKTIVIVFDTERAAFEGRTALKELHNNGDISLYATGIIVKDPSGSVTIKDPVEKGPVGTGVGLLVGSLVGLLGGPVTTALGGWAGALFGSMRDLVQADVDVGFVDEISKALTPGKVALVAEADEDRVTPVNTRLGQLGGLVFRHQRFELYEDRLVRESAAFNDELKQLENELQSAAPASAPALHRQIDAVREKLELTEVHASARTQHLGSEMQARINALREQMTGASEPTKTAIGFRMDDVRADYTHRISKLDQARSVARAALAA